MYEEVEIEFGGRKRIFKVVKKPKPHIVVESKKEIHGWLKPRECTSERFLLNPYNGCHHNCFYCYAHYFPFQYFKLFRKRKIVTVFKNFDKVVDGQLNQLNIAFCGYLSPVTDPFQSVEKRYRLSEKIVEVFVKKNIPVEVVTKGKIPKNVIHLLKKQKHSFAQISILTLNEDLRKMLMEGGAKTEVLLGNFERLSNNNVFSVARIDPIIPFLNDKNLEELIEEVFNHGANHVVTSVLDIPKADFKFFLNQFDEIEKGLSKKFIELYKEKFKQHLHARIEYREKIFLKMREICKKIGVGFALCMEFHKNSGLNKKFSTTINCEGIDTPIYIREGDCFKPFDCLGNCLNCKTPKCGIEELMGGGSWKFRDYKRWDTFQKKLC